MESPNGPQLSPFEPHLDDWPKDHDLARREVANMLRLGDTDPSTPAHRQLVSIFTATDRAQTQAAISAFRAGPAMQHGNETPRTATTASAEVARERQGRRALLSHNGVENVIDKLRTTPTLRSTHYRLAELPDVTGNEQTSQDELVAFLAELEEGSVVHRDEFVARVWLEDAANWWHDNTQRPSRINDRMLWDGISDSLALAAETSEPSAYLGAMRDAALQMKDGPATLARATPTATL